MEKITIGEALTTSVIGICVVMLILAIIAVLIILVSKVIRTVEAKASKVKKSDTAITPVAAPVSAPAVSGAGAGEVDLVGVDEKTAAVVMAIVSNQSNIPLNRLSFKSIRLMDENEKGGNK